MKLRPTEAEQALRTGAKGITPFHWEIEFPEVFGRENAGFDCIVGNPPFAGWEHDFRPSTAMRISIG